jgi:hypothetical protein
MRMGSGEFATHLPTVRRCRDVQSGVEYNLEQLA